MNALQEQLSADIGVNGFITQKRKNSLPEKPAYTSRADKNEKDVPSRDMKNDCPTFHRHPVLQMLHSHGHQREQPTADGKCQDGGVDEGFDDVPLGARELLDAIAVLELPEEQLYRPANGIKGSYLLRRDRLDGDVGQVQVVALRQFVVDSDQTEAGPCAAASVLIGAPAKLHFHLEVEDGSPQMPEDLLKVLADERLRTTGVYGSDDRIGPFLEPRDKVATLPGDPVEQLEAVIPQVEKKQLAPHPRSRLEHGTIVHSLAGDPDAPKAPASGVDDHMELGGGLGVVGSAGGIGLFEQVVELDDRRVGHEHIEKRRADPVPGRLGRHEIVDEVRHEGFEHIDKLPREAIVESGRRDVDSQGLLIGPPQPRKGALGPRGEAEDESPYEYHDIDFPLSLNHPVLGSQLSKAKIWNTSCQDISNCNTFIPGHPPASSGNVVSQSKAGSDGPFQILDNRRGKSPGVFRILSQTMVLSEHRCSSSSRKKRR